MNNAYEEKNGDLTLLNVQTGDAGAYICQATNSYGTANSVVTLLVHGNSTYISKGTCSDHLVVIQLSHFISPCWYIVTLTIFISTGTCYNHRIVYSGIYFISP